MGHKELRRKAKQTLGKYGSLEVTWSRFDCGQDDEGTPMGCGECVVCKYLDFIENAEVVGKPPGSTIAYNRFIDKYNQLVYGV
jgi:hypothetical protein